MIGDKAQTVLELLHLSLQPVVTISRYQVSGEAMSLKRSAKSLNNSANSTPTKKEPKMQESNRVSLEEIWTVISSMNEKLTKLDKLDAMETRLNNIDGEINNLKHSLTYQHDTTTEIQSSQKKQNEQIKKLEERVSKIEEEKEKMNREIVNIKACSIKAETWQNVIDIHDPNESYSTFMKTFTDKYNKHFPLRPVKEQK